MQRPQETPLPQDGTQNGDLFRPRLTHGHWRWPRQQVPAFLYSQVRQEWGKGGHGGVLRDGTTAKTSLFFKRHGWGLEIGKLSLNGLRLESRLPASRGSTPGVQLWSLPSSGLTPGLGYKRPRRAPPLCGPRFPHLPRPVPQAPSGLCRGMDGKNRGAPILLYPCVGYPLELDKKTPLPLALPCGGPSG